jgi:L-alanine-DL-glutamate epimerase-like enolase superfamily enzyme
VKRRYFISALAASAAVRVGRPAGTRITRIRVAPIEGRFHKFVTMNSYDRVPKGHTYSNHLIRIEAGQDVEGVGVMGYRAPDEAFYKALRTLIGADPLSLYQMAGGRITGRSPAHEEMLRAYPFLDGVMFDLIGKLTGKAVWRLIGDSVRNRVETYDGTLYFSDVWFRDRGVRAVVEEAEEAMKAGYRGIKLKLGRGWRWMEPEPGFRRDVEVVHAVRKAVGPDMRISVDINNGYQKEPDRAWRLLQETAADNLYFLEEPFPEQVRLYTDLRTKMQKAGIRTLIADGENVRQSSELAAYLEPKVLVDVLQMDIRTCGLLENASLARRAGPLGAISIPHNWGSQVGGLMGLHLSKAVKEVPAAEDDRSTCDVVTAEGYEFRAGSYTLPDKPGLSIHVNEDVYQLKCKAAEVVIG